MSCTDLRFALPAPVSALSVFVDFDGTLVPIADTPDAIELPDTLPALLEQAAERLERRLVLVSGRTIADLDGHLGAHRIGVAGSHGMEFRLDGESPDSAEPIDSQAVEDALREMLGDPGDILFERKRFGLAVHYRQAPDRRSAVEEATGQVADGYGLAIKPGKMVVELVARGGDKGTAVRRILATPAFAGTVPLYIGDDVTDEDGFRAVRDLGGLGVLVGDRQGSAAEAHLPGPAAVHALLMEIAEAPR